MKLFGQLQVVLVASSAALGFASMSDAQVDKGENATCDRIIPRVPWQSLTKDEKNKYINADLCLISTPSKGDVPGAVTRWDDLQYSHVLQTITVHRVGAFLPFHRYYMTAHEHLIREECGYAGRMPYWDEPADLEDMAASVLWDENAFGGNGSGDDHCLRNGPFANLTLRFDTDAGPTEHCLTRNFSQPIFNEAAQENVDECNAIDSYAEAWECWSLAPHNAGHGGVGGIMLDSTLSPGDPVFYLHHSYLDKLWWEWQKLAPSRFWGMGGPNIPKFLDPSDPTYPGPEYTDYFGDGRGNVTTLNHNLYMTGLLPNVTIGDIMDIRGPVLCTDYE